MDFNNDIDDIETSDSIPTTHKVRIVIDKTVNKNIEHSTLKLKDIKNLSLYDLQTKVSELSVENFGAMSKQELTSIILKKAIEKGSTVVGQGVLEVLSDGFGFLRASESNYANGGDDIYVSPSQIRRFGLRTG